MTLNHIEKQNQDYTLDSKKRSKELVITHSPRES